jgi:hypothetical protein
VKVAGAGGNLALAMPGSRREYFLHLAHVVKHDAGDGRSEWSTFGSERQEGLRALGHAQGMLKQAVTIGMVHAGERRRRLYEDVRHALLPAADKVDEQVARRPACGMRLTIPRFGFHLHRVMLRDGREAAHDRRIRTFSIGDPREGVDLEVGDGTVKSPTTPPTRATATRAGLEG